jgi:hypothetical protein
MKQRRVDTKKKIVKHQKIEKTAVIDVLWAIKMKDPYLTYGKIISRAARQNALRPSQVGHFLNNVTDKNFEKILKGYLAPQI